jgi:hypothetical protein
MGGWVDGWIGGWMVYEAYAFKKRGGKLRCLLLRRKKSFFYIYL